MVEVERKTMTKPKAHDLKKQSIPAIETRWFWIYGRITPGEAKYDVHEVHQFPMPVDMTIVPVGDEGGTKQLLARNQIPICTKNIWPSLDTEWSVFNTGAADPRRLATISGTRVTICPDCTQLEQEATKK
jgi:hypothetical protein